MKKNINYNIIDPEQLKVELKSKFIKIIDCRWFLQKNKNGFEEFKKSHIPNAIHFDLEKISNSKINIPHMMPTSIEFRKFLTRNNISKKNEIVIYDQSGFFCSARVWFTFKCFNFKKVRILDGGFNLWIENNFPVDKIIKKSKKGNYDLKDLKKNNKMIISFKDLKQKILTNRKITIFDARSQKRFKGLEPEPRKDLKSGNIPGSINFPYNEISSDNGKILSTDKLKSIFNRKKILKKNDEIICTCGSGITACNIILALDILGYKKLKLYDGSWAEWGRK
ncbi:MAG: 3-mercaptopyruvate sulfurtransferase [Alphaproteobacteria bacterium MarineAlpha8_Bin1]|nr:MAG: 3-mercaptopyruvate sulfurtransferase [Alphaproteobacteria bacterium MarineAlpha8_Bin1]|tara:strand:+ start:35 stop:874 length:840 start_codon:yes stop_codon:yes gene_type:complete